jgi:hypothetical protein
VGEVGPQRQARIWGMATSKMRLFVGPIGSKSYCGPSNLFVSGQFYFCAVDCVSYECLFVARMLVVAERPVAW